MKDDSAITQEGTEVVYRLTCACGWDETSTSLEWLQDRSISHGYSDEKHRWRIENGQGEVIDNGR